GESLTGIARWLTDAGYRTRHGKPWSSSTVRTLLRNPRYAGHVVYRGETMPNHGGWRPLVTPETFAVVQHRLNDPRRRTHRHGTDRKHLGSGLYRCTCGRPVRAWSDRRYRCAGGCYLRSGAQVDQLVEAVIAERLSRPDLADLLADTVGTQRAEDLLAEASKLRDRLVAIEGDYDAGLIDGRRYAVATEKIAAAVQAVETERAALLAGTGPAAVLTAPDPAAAFLAASLMVRRATVDFFAVVTLLPAPRGRKAFDPATVRVEWKGSRP
ncbi:MAG: recombinase family protein, partial [Actinomycetota bacterium]|nr:recombinase family protein [Actinomycetota bacterium]